jgi:RHS repeat-associated protein
MQGGRDVVVEGPLAPYADGFWVELAGLGYQRGHAVKQMRLLAHLSEWIGQREVAPAELSAECVAEFFLERKQSGKRQLFTPRAGRALLAYLRQAGDKTAYTWKGSLLTSSIDPTGIESTTIYDQADRPTDDYGPAPSSSFTGLTSPSAPHASTAYDEGILGLAASYFDDPTLSPSAPTMTVHATGAGDPTGALDASWGTNPPPGVSSSWSARFTGEVTPTATGSYTFSVTGTGTAAVYVSDTLVSGPVTLTAGTPVRIRVDYTPPTGSASLGLDWAPPAGGGPSGLIPGADLDPRYGLVTSKVDADGKKSATRYAEAGVGPEEGLPTAQIVDPAGLDLISPTTYEPKGTGYFRVSTTALPAGVSTTVTDAYYGAVQTSTTDNCASGGVIQAGLLATETGAGPNPVVHDFAYDAAGRVVASEVVGDPAWSCTTYDARGRVSSSSDSSGKTTSYDYSNPAVVKTTYTDSSGAAKSTASQVDFDGRLISYTDELANTTTSSYDQASRVTATARGSTALTAVTYDNASRVATVVDKVGSATGGGLVSFSYDAAGRITSTVRPNSVTTTQSYDPHGWLNGITNTASSGPLPSAANSSYVYSPAKRIVSQTTEGQSSTFGYDGAGRLTSTVVGATTTTYAYDADSNRCAVDAATCNGTFSYTAADRITASPGVASYAYNYRGDVTQTATGATISYDANDHATATNDGNAVTPTVVNNEVGPTGRVLQTSAGPLNLPLSYDNVFGYDSPSSDSPSYVEGTLGGLLITSYLNGPGGLLAEDASLLGIVTSTYPLTNAHGDVVGTANSSGAFTANPTTDPFGVASSAPANSLGYLGNDERFTTGGALDLVQMGVRLYDPSLGRFLQPDPVPGGSANAYDYCSQDPVNCLDLQGTWGWGNVTKWWRAHGSTVITFAGIVVGAVCAGAVGCALIAAGVGATAVFNSAYVNHYISGKRTKANTKAFEIDLAFSALGVVLGAVGGGAVDKLGAWGASEGLSTNAGALGFNQLEEFKGVAGAVIGAVSGATAAEWNNVGDIAACQNARC